MKRIIGLRFLIGTVAALTLWALPAASATCDLVGASSWIRSWLAAWELTSRDILRLPDAPAPQFVLFDSACVYTTSAATAPRATSHAGLAMGGASLTWRAAAHGDTLDLPDGKRVPVGLMSFASSDRKTGPFFVMAAPSYWAAAGHGEQAGLTGVFLHEFTHTRQMHGVAHVLGPIDSLWKGEQELDDNVVQRAFGSDSSYIRAYLAEHDLFYRAAHAASRDSALYWARQALSMLKNRHARWFTGEHEVLRALDDTFLSMEGAGQWAAAAWLSHPKGGGLSRAAAVEKMLGRRRWWVQDEGLAIFLAVERLLPSWPTLVFRDPSAGVIELLEQATRE